MKIKWWKTEKEEKNIITESSPSLEEEEHTAQEKEAVPAGMKEIILDAEEKKKRITFIENPLPVPKRREHKAMDFAIGLADENDDYDIKDVSGMDFFDIE